jgi:uncharacterized protein YlzI (FlbEa/FlbD family)
MFLRMNSMKKIEISDEVSVPGTDIVLEKGDTIVVKESAEIEYAVSLKNMLKNLSRIGGSSFELGKMLTIDVISTLDGQVDPQTWKSFVNGMSNALGSRKF